MSSPMREPRRSQGEHPLGTPPVDTAAGQSASGLSDLGRLAHELAHVVPAHAASTPPIARQPAAPAPALRPAVSHYEEIPLGPGRVRLHAWGRVGDPIERPGLEKKYPEPGKVGLPGHDRWHLAGPNATGAEEGIAYAPTNFNVSKTAELENVIRKARIVTQEQGGEVFFDFTADCTVVGEYEGVAVRTVDSAHWTAEVRAAGSDTLTQILDVQAAVPQPTPPAVQAPAAPETEPAAAPPVATAKPIPTTPATTVESPPVVPGTKGLPPPIAEPVPTPRPPVEGPSRHRGPPPSSRWSLPGHPGGRVSSPGPRRPGGCCSSWPWTTPLGLAAGQGRAGHGGSAWHTKAWARREKDAHPDQPVYITWTVRLANYQRFIPLLGWQASERTLTLDGFTIGQSRLESPTVEVHGRHDLFYDGETRITRFSELLIA